MFMAVVVFTAIIKKLLFEDLQECSDCLPLLDFSLNTFHSSKISFSVIVVGS